MRLIPMNFFLMTWRIFDGVKKMFTFFEKKSNIPIIFYTFIFHINYNKSTY